ncbi:transposase, partial [Galbibacter sp. EGI 63066]|uniref:transposase n=1 Tax=Galbibacter sp. EGI 63066 TaxID=2993559 RepID=UPI00224958CB
MYLVPDKDTIKSEIAPYLPTGKRGFPSKFSVEEIINAILYKLKTGVQWGFLPVKSLFEGDIPSWQTVYH